MVNTYCFIKKKLFIVGRIHNMKLNQIMSKKIWSFNHNIVFDPFLNAQFSIKTIHSISYLRAKIISVHLLKYLFASDIFRRSFRSKNMNIFSRQSISKFVSKSDSVWFESLQLSSCWAPILDVLLQTRINLNEGSKNKIWIRHEIDEIINHVKLRTCWPSKQILRTKLHILQKWM